MTTGTVVLLLEGLGARGEVAPRKGRRTTLDERPHRRGRGRGRGRVRVRRRGSYYLLPTTYYLRIHLPL